MSRMSLSCPECNKPSKTGNRCKSCANRARWSNPAAREEQSRKLQATHSDPSIRAKLSASARERWENPSYREKVVDALNQPDVKAKMSARLKKRWANPKYRQEWKERLSDPEYINNLSERQSTRWKDPAYRQIMEEHYRAKKVEYRCIDCGKAVSRRDVARCASCANKAMWADPKHGNKRREAMQSAEYRQKVSEINTCMWTEPCFRERHQQIMQSVYTDSEYRQKQSENKKSLWKSREYREKVLSSLPRGEDHYLWSGGTSDYPPEFNDSLKSSVRARDNYSCVLCEELEDDMRHHDTHHIDYDKQNNDLGNLITLCKGCHTKTNFNRAQWEPLLLNLI